MITKTGAYIINAKGDFLSDSDKPQEIKPLGFFEAMKDTFTNSGLKNAERQRMIDAQKYNSGIGANVRDIASDESIALAATRMNDASRNHRFSGGRVAFGDDAADKAGLYQKLLQQNGVAVTNAYGLTGKSLTSALNKFDKDRYDEFGEYNPGVLIYGGANRQAMNSLRHDYDSLFGNIEHDFTGAK